MGDVSYESGPDGMFPAKRLALALRDLGVETRRFKTGTPSRVNRRSVDFADVLCRENKDVGNKLFSVMLSEV